MKIVKIKVTTTEQQRRVRRLVVEIPDDMTEQDVLSIEPTALVRSAHEGRVCWDSHYSDWQDIGGPEVKVASAPSGAYAEARLLRDENGNAVWERIEAKGKTLPPKKGRFKVWRIPDGKFQVLVDDKCGFVVEFDGVRLERGVDVGDAASVGSTDAFFWISDAEYRGLIEAIKDAPMGPRISGVCGYGDDSADSPAVEAVSNADTGERLKGPGVWDEEDAELAAEADKRAEAAFMEEVRRLSTEEAEHE